MTISNEAVEVALAAQHKYDLSPGNWDAKESVRAALEAAGEIICAEAWDRGFATGKSRAMRHMSDEPNLPLTAPNPYRTQAEAEAEAEAEGANNE